MGLTLNLTAGSVPEGAGNLTLGPCCQELVGQEFPLSKGNIVRDIRVEKMLPDCFPNQWIREAHGTGSSLSFRNQHNLINSE